MSGFRQENSTFFDVILCEPPPLGFQSLVINGMPKTKANHVIDETEVTEFVSFVEKVLKPTGYLVLLSDLPLYYEWVKAFSQSTLDVMPHPYTITYSSDSIQNRNPKVFPQCSTLFGLVAHIPGRKDFKNLS